MRIIPHIRKEARPCEDIYNWWATSLGFVCVSAFQETAAYLLHYCVFDVAACNQNAAQLTALDSCCSLVKRPAEDFNHITAVERNRISTHLLQMQVVKLYCSVIPSLHISSICMASCVCVCVCFVCAWVYNSRELRLGCQDMYANETKTKTESSVSFNVWTQFQIPPVTSTETQTHSKGNTYVCLSWPRAAPASHGICEWKITT